jgi:hypothetical protein
VRLKEGLGKTRIFRICSDPDRVATGSNEQVRVFALRRHNCLRPYIGSMGQLGSGKRRWGEFGGHRFLFWLLLQLTCSNQQLSRTVL